MTKEEALALIDNHKNRLTNPAEMLHWTYLRVYILNITDAAWKEAGTRAMETLSR